MFKINQVLKILCAVMAIGFLASPFVWAGPSDGDYIPPSLEPQLSSDGNTLYGGAQPVIIVNRPKPPDKLRRIPSSINLVDLAETASATFSITYLPAGGSDLWGEPCFTFPEEAKAAFNAAAAIWGNLLQSSVPITINACWANLGSTSTLGYAGGGTLHRNFTGAQLTNTWYSASLANALNGSDLDSANADMHITYNSNFSWYYGTNGNPPLSQYDLMTVVLHEIGHGLNFSGTALYSGGLGSLGLSGYPSIYDRFMRDGSGTLLTAYTSPSVSLGSVLTSGDLWFHGSNAMAANGGGRVKMYAPTTWTAGSSYSHLDYATFNNTANQLMVYAISAGESIHDPGTVTKGLLKDLGWPSYTQQFGSLTVTISPQGAVTAGGQWRRVGTATWLNSGSTESGIPVGSYTVEFKTVAGWTTPSAVGVTIYDGQTATASGTYIQGQQFGSLTVTISPQGAVTAGGQWRRVSTATWLNSGSTESGIPVGSYTVEFKTVAGWTTPSSVGVTVNNGVTATASGTYVQIQQVGSLTVTISTISPQGAIDAGGQWRRVGSTPWFYGGFTETGIPVGLHTVEFKPVTGWETPASVLVTINNGQTATASGTYVRELIPIIQVTPSSLGFGSVPVGSTKDRSLTVKNLGGWFYLTGNATTAAPFSIVQGSYYNLGPDQSQVVTVRYQPTSPGPHTGTVVFTGGDGATVQVTDKTEKPHGLPWLMLLLD